MTCRSRSCSDPRSRTTRAAASTAAPSRSSIASPTGLTLRNNLLTGRYDKSYQNVYPGTAVSAADTLTLSAYNHVINRTNTFNQTDLIYTTRLAGTTHTLLGGMELGDQLQDELRHTAAPLPNVPLSNTVRNANFAAAPVAIDRNAESTVVAGYFQDQVGLANHWKAVVGARLDRFGVSVDDHLPTGSDLSRTDTKLSPRAGLIYQPTDHASIYASYSYTFLPSGQTLGLTPTTAQVGPENAKNYEVGVKLERAERTARRLDRNFPSRSRRREEHRSERPDAGGADGSAAGDGRR